MAEVMASQVRSAMVSGEPAASSALPDQDDLIDQFRDGAASSREAVRILEYENLVSVHRGKLDRALVHRPCIAAATHGLGLPLEVEQVPVSIPLGFVASIAPLCAARRAEPLDLASAGAAT